MYDAHMCCQPTLTFLQTGESLSIDESWEMRSTLPKIDQTKVGAILVKTDGEKGAVRITGRHVLNGVKDFETGKQKTEVILITLQEGQEVTLWGHPTVRLFHRL